MEFVAGIGAFTALFASLIAVAQWDIKRVLAYSTIAQLGFMIAALGTGAYVAGLFHLITHAFFKALLFLGSGSVIHGVEHGFHHAHEHAAAVHGHDDHGHHGSRLIARKDGNLDPNDPQDMRNMGGSAQADADHGLDVHHRRHGAGGLPLCHRRLLVEG
jgi:NADH-quinone oxidoreductase subunit L